MCTLNKPAAPSSTVQALAMVSAGLGYLAGCDAADLGTAAQAEALVGLEQAEAQHTAARAKILAAFTSQGGYQADGQYGPKVVAAGVHEDHAGGGGRGGRVGAAAGRAPGDRGRAGGRADLGVVGAADLRLDRAAARRPAPGRGPDPARGRGSAARTCMIWRCWRGR